MRLIGEEGDQVGIIPLQDALQRGEEKGLDVVEINPTSRPPVVKLMDYGKYRYEQSKKEREARQKRNVITVKEIKFRPKIDTHDYETKKRRVVKFLKNGDKVKLTCMFRGREMIYRKRGVEMLNELAEDLSEISNIERRPKYEGRNVTLILAPKSSG